ncbi:MAG: VWA domain-containing protein, partial [Chloroflexota bacterium]|nr:VWA domain-containing protein [Chloroflexota bacterium]
TDVTKEYEFGDPFLLDLPKTVMNAVQRGGAGAPVRLNPRDFDVYRTEYSTRTATVLMVDMSRSMLYNGCFTAAKKVALALDSLIRSKYPRDQFNIVGFHSRAQELKPAELPMLDWNEYTYGTNMQHGFQLARQLLGRSKGSNRQIIVVTDGEPTAYLDGLQVRFSYPPTPRTLEETLKEVVRCTRDGITINTFMLERSPYMVQFINDLMKINTGRVFVATPDRLGEYILVDYVANKRKWIG